jgi:hypothetical protein
MAGGDLHKMVDIFARGHGEEVGDRDRDIDEGGKDDGGENEDARTDSSNIVMSPDVKGVEERRGESAPSSSETGGSILVFRSIRSIEPEREKDTVRLYRCIFDTPSGLEQIAPSV